MTRTRRSAQELIEESEVRLAKLREKAALDQAKQSPELAPIVEAIQENTAAITESQRGLGSGPQSFESRAAKNSFPLPLLVCPKVFSTETMLPLIFLKPSLVYLPRICWKTQQSSMV